MKSKTLNKKDREIILSTIREVANAKAQESPNFEQMIHLQRRMQLAISAKQGAHITPINRRTLKKFNAIHEDTVVVQFSRNDTGGFYSIYFYGREDCAKITFDILSLTGRGDNERHQPFGRFSDYLFENHAELLGEYFDLYVLINCEVNKYVSSWEEILLKLRTSKRVVDQFPEAKDFMPDYILNHAPNTGKSEAILKDVSDAYNVVKSFGE